MGRLSVILFALAAACGGKKAATTTTAGDAAHGESTSPAPKDLSYVHGDVTIAGTYYAPAAATGACAIFVHQLSSNRGEWQPVVDRLRGRAHLYAIDMRGHGASTGGPKGFADFTASDWQAVETDLDGAVDVIKQQGGSPPCVLVGASIGSSAVLRYAAAAPDHARALVLLSPGLSYHGLDTPPAAHATQVPVLIVHSQEPGAADAAGALAGIWTDAKVPVEVVADPGTAHGMKIVNGDRKVLDKVVGFLEQNLGL